MAAAIAVVGVTCGDTTRDAASAENEGRPFERVFADPPDSLVAYLGTAPWSLARPQRVAVSAEGRHAYVMDTGALVVRQFALDGQFIRDYGQGQGPGPGEFLSLSDVEVDGAGQVWTMDPAQGRIQVFDQAGDVIETIRTPGNATAFERTPADGIVLVMLDSLLFRLLDSDGAVVRNFGRLTDDQLAKAIAVWGFVDASGSSVFCSGAYGGFLGRWSADNGAEHYLRPTVVEQPFPDPVHRDGAFMVAPEDRRGASFGLAAGRDTVYVLGSDGDRYLADVYEAEHGGYLYSVPLPEPNVAALSVTTDHFVLALDTLVAVWSRHPG